MACAAGKDVYVEKPLTLFVREGRWMVEVARRIQARGAGGHAAALRASTIKRPCEMMRAGYIGKIVERAHGLVP